MSLKNAEQFEDDSFDLETEINNAIENIDALIVKSVRAMKEAESNAAAVKSRIADLEARQSRFESRARAIRSVVFSAFDAMGWTKFQHPEFTVTVGKPRDSLIITDEAQLPSEYIRTKSEPDKALITSALKAGTEIPGAVLSNGLPSLTIRTK